MNRLPLILLLAASACATQPPVHNLRAKADADILDVVDRYSFNDVDTTVTIEAVLSAPVTDARRTEIVAQCGLTVLDRLDSTAMIICPSQSLPCLGVQPEFRTFRMVPAWSPDL